MVDHNSNNRFKETLKLLHGLMNITALTLCSEKKIQVEYFDSEFIVNYILGSTYSNRLLDIEVLLDH